MCIRDRYQPLRVAQQTAIIFAGTRGFLDDIEVSRVGDFEQGFYQHVDVNDSSLWDDIETAGKLDKDLEARLGRMLDDYKLQAEAVADDGEE